MISKLLLFSAGLFHFATTGLIAQEGQDVGFIRLANATGFDGALMVTIDDIELSTSGYESGATTGSFGLRVGPHKLVVKHPMCEDSEYPFSLEKEQQLAIIAYGEPKFDAETGKIIKQTIQFVELERKGESNDRTATLLFLSINEGITLDLNSDQVTLERMKQQNIKFQDARGSQIAIATAGKNLGGLEIENPGDYAIVVFDKPNGTQGVITFYNSRHN